MMALGSSASTVASAAVGPVKTASLQVVGAPVTTTRNITLWKLSELSAVAQYRPVVVLLTEACELLTSTTGWRDCASISIGIVARSSKTLKARLKIFRVFIFVF